MEEYIADKRVEPQITTLRFRHKNGHIVWVLSRYKGVVNKEGKLNQIIGTLTDITTFKEDTNTLEQLAHRDVLTRSYLTVQYLWMRFYVPLHAQKEITAYLR